MNFWLIYTVMLGVPLIDIAVKEWYVKLLPKRIDENCPYNPRAGWKYIPNFWKDSIPGGRWYRIRWSYVLNGAGIIFTWYWLGLPSAIAYWWLVFCNAESIFYQWFKKLVHLKNPDYKWFDLQDDEEWMKCLPFNKWFAKYLYHCYKDYEMNPHKLTYTGWINPEVIYLVFILGNIMLFTIDKITRIIL
jgi:hypothetical protein